MNQKFKPTLLLSSAPIFPRGQNALPAPAYVPDARWDTSAWTGRPSVGVEGDGGQPGLMLKQLQVHPGTSGEPLGIWWPELAPTVWREPGEGPPQPACQARRALARSAGWAETEWLSRSWVCLLAAPGRKLRVWGLGLRVGVTEQVQGLGPNQNSPQAQENVSLLAVSASQLQT